MGVTIITENMFWQRWIIFKQNSNYLTFQQWLKCKTDHRKHQALFWTMTGVGTWHKSAPVTKTKQMVVQDSECPQSKARGKNCGGQACNGREQRQGLFQQRLLHRNRPCRMPFPSTLSKLPTTLLCPSLLKTQSQHQWPSSQQTSVAIN